MVRSLAKEDNTLEEYQLNNMHEQGAQPLKIQLVINKKDLEMELNTGSAVSLVSQQTFKRLWPKTPLEALDVVLKTYSRERIKTVRKDKVTVRYNTQSWDADLLVVQEDGPSLLGQDWIQLQHLDLQTVHLVQHDKLKTLLSKYSSVFQEGLGLLKGLKAKIYVEQDARPKYFRAHSVPYSLKVKIENQLDKLVKEGVIEPVQHAEWLHQYYQL